MKMFYYFSILIAYFFMASKVLMLSFHFEIIEFQHSLHIENLLIH